MSKLCVRIDVPIAESVKDDATFAARAYGFKSSADWVRWLIERELYGSLVHIERLVHSSPIVTGKPVGTSSL